MSATGLPQIYDRQDFTSWADSTGLLLDEATLFERYVWPLPRDVRILELGTGGGRLAFELDARGFHRITATDLSPRMIAAAQEHGRQRQACIHFEVQDAADLRLPDASFDLVIGLAQVFSLIDSSEARARAFAHVHRVLTPGGGLILSAASWESRPLNRWIARAIAPLKWLKGESRFARHYLPFLKLGGKPNLRFPIEKQAYVYYFPQGRLEQDLSDAGFEIVELRTSRMLRANVQTFLPGGYLYGMVRRPDR